MNTCAMHILCGTIHITHSMPSIIIVSSQNILLSHIWNLSDVIEIIECKRYIHKHARTHTLYMWLDLSYIYRARIRMNNMKTSHTHTHILHALQSFINLPFRLSLLAALHVLNACMKMIIISVLNLIRQHLDSSSFSNHQFEQYNHRTDKMNGRTN